MNPCSRGRRVGLHSLFSDDNLQPITVSNEDEEETFSSFSFAQIILKSQSKFPKTLPFSKSVLVIHQLLQKYIASGKFIHTGYPSGPPGGRRL